MKTTRRRDRQAARGLSQSNELQHLVVKPLADLIDRQRIDYVEQLQKIFTMLEHLEGLIEVIAGQMKRELT
jgi:hypothetical protein